jgi:hypothetical protein
MNCLKCGEELDDFSSTTGGVIPKAGDVSICLYCSNIAIYTGNLMDIRPATSEELAEISNDPKTLKAIAITMMFRAMDRG